MDAASLCLAAWIALWLLGPEVFAGAGWHAYALVLAPPLLVLPSLWLSRCYETVVRFVSINSIVQILRGIMLGYGILAGSLVLFGGWSGDVRFLTAVPLIASSLLIGWRLGAAQFLRLRTAPAGGTRPVLIYGAGEAGLDLAEAMAANRHYRPVGFVDDRPSLHGRLIGGLPVYAPEALGALKGAALVDRVLLAMPSASRKRRREILEKLERLSLKVLIVPSLDELVSGERCVDDLREVQIEDLLGRDPVPEFDGLTERHIRGRVVMVTGAGGSIGGELCRQALRHGACKLVLFELSEFALYTIDRELRGLPQAAQCEIVPVLGTVNDRLQVLRTLRAHAVESIYHAAAYKHVPLVEQNVVVAVRNNVFGTLAVVQAAVEARVPNFVMISSDKAVRPASVMGASKRACELLVQATAQQKPATQMSIVRFGNVLASSGSVVPLFKEQIAGGGPVTVTHAQVTRYFMTIQEAAQLVIQAGAMGGRGEIYVLDMGEPVRIAELAERMIRLSGLSLCSEANPGGDIEIKFTGLRPGEKLHEELLIGSRRQSTEHARIFLDNEAIMPWPALSQSIRQLEAAIDTGSAAEVRGVLHALVDGFKVRGSVPAVTAANDDDELERAVLAEAPVLEPVLRTSAATR